MFEVVQNRRVWFGAGALGQLRDIVGSYHVRKVLLLTFNPDSAVSRRIQSDLTACGVGVHAMDPVVGEPDLESIDRTVAVLRKEECDCVLALGGGSVLDAAKAVAMIATNGGTAEEYQMQGRQAGRPALPLIAVPTTAGTGSEATKVSVVYNGKTRLKKSFYSPSMIADAVILDPEATVDLPPRVTASTGIDALSHAIESYVSLNATPYSQMNSLKAVELIGRSLVAAFRDGHDIGARTDMLYASFFAGCALQAGIGLAHIIAQPLGGLLKIPHGDACSIFLPYSMEYNMEYRPQHYGDLARVLGASLKERGPHESRSLIPMVKDLIAAVGAPRSIRPYLKDGAFDLDGAVAVIQGATGHIKCNPGPVDAGVLKRAIEAVS